MKDFKQIVNENIKKKKTFVFVSPHFDDAVYSAGGLISYLSGKKAKVEIINVFTKADKPPYTLSAKHNLHMSGFSDAQELYRRREKEDREIFKSLGIKVHNLGYKEALFRKKKHKYGRVLNTIIPEISHIYPFYLTSIIKGKIADGERKLIKDIFEKIENNLKEKNVLLFAPFANSNHIDHLLVKKALCNLSKPLIFWEDYPYNARDKSSHASGKNNKTFIFDQFQKERLRLIKTYQTQVKNLFPGGRIILTPEKYFSDIAFLNSQRKKEKSLTVALPAYNEEKNIGNIIKAIFSQKGRHGLSLVKVYLDGSSDDTEKILFSLRKKYPRLIIVSDKTKKGKYYRVNQAFRENRSDYLVVLDADVLPKDEYLLEKLVNFAKENPQYLMIAAHNVLIRPKNFIGKFLYANFLIWDQVRLSIPKYIHPENFFGTATLYTKDFTQSVVVPDKLVDPHLFIYLSAHVKEGFGYCPDAEVLQWPISNFSDFAKLMRRTIGKRDHQLEKIFSIKTEEILFIPVKYKLFGLVKSLWKEPFYTSFALVFIYINKFITWGEMNTSTVWEVVHSTKKPINKSDYMTHNK